MKTISIQGKKNSSLGSALTPADRSKQGPVTMKKSASIDFEHFPLQVEIIRPASYYLQKAQEEYPANFQESPLSGGLVLTNDFDATFTVSLR